MFKWVRFDSYNGLVLKRRQAITYAPPTVWGKITYPFPNFNGAAVEVW